MGLGADITLADLEADPDPILERMRQEEPVCWVPSMDMWLVTRWVDVAYVEGHPELFSAATDPVAITDRPKVAGEIWPGLPNDTTQHRGAIFRHVCQHCCQTLAEFRVA